MINNTYQPQELEKNLYETWEKAGYFQAQGENKAYSIVIPPPNVTGTLHMGHGFQHTIMDALIRYNRMQGAKTLWQPGTDHAGIATQMVVERKLQLEENKSRHDLGREKFLERVWEWKEQSGGQISQQIRRMGSSPDWARERFTMDEGLSASVREVFIRLFDEGLIYRGQRLVNWDPKLHTAISDLEVISEEEKGFMWHINYPLADGNGAIEVATTRPETLLGDTAVAVHPDDERYKHLIGKMINLPLTNRQIPIIADEYVDPAFGTGCVKITPAHDFNDYEVGKRHQLPMINIFTIDAMTNENVPAEYQNLDRFVAREKVVADLKAKNLLIKIENHVLKVPRGDRSGVVIEPYLTDQWFVKIAPLAKPAIDAVKSGEIQFIPENWSKTYFQWMENIEDWCISRQLWWGHRIPAWYDEAGKIYVAQDEKAVREKYKLSDQIKLTQDNDVLDTWFSSAIWPFATLGWPHDLETLNTFYPTSVLVTGFDIIFFWVARMIMFGLKFTGQVPFKHVYITGLIRDSEGQKMSKSKGNILDPIDLIDGVELDLLIKKRTYGLMQPEMAKRIEQDTKKQFPEGIAAHGTDALRFTYCALASHGRDIRFDLGRLEGYRNFCNKLWNAARFVFMNTESHTITKPETNILSIADCWILSRLQQVIKDAHRYFAEYRFDFLSQLLYEFTWYEFCDWYLELCKVVLNNENANAAEKNATRHTLLTVLETICRLLHPIMPFITETIWLAAAKLLNLAGDSIMLQAYPTEHAELHNASAEQAIEWLKAVTLAIRNIRGEMNISPGKKLPILLRKGTKEDYEYFTSAQSFLLSLARLEKIEWLEENAAVPASATAICGQLEIFVPMAGFIDKEAELNRLAKELEKLNQEIEKIQVKLSNANFVDKAPAQVVAKEKDRVLELQEMQNKLQDQREKIFAL